MYIVSNKAAPLPAPWISSVGKPSRPHNSPFSPSSTHLSQSKVSAGTRMNRVPSSLCLKRRCHQRVLLRETDHALDDAQPRASGQHLDPASAPALEGANTCASVAV